MPNDPSATSTASATVDRIQRRRRTTKVLAENDLPLVDRRADIEQLIVGAGWAPFHRTAHAIHQDREDLPSVLPWRFYMLDSAACRRLRGILLERGDVTKIPKMLATAEASIQVTWLPNPSTEPVSGLFKADLANMEHIAAASAAVQNLLLAATARDIATYWSSGGALRSPELFEILGIPASEILLGSIFLFPDPSELEGVEIKHTKLRDQRGPIEHWARWVEIDG